MMRLAAFLIFVLAASGAHAQCYKDVGQKSARGFGTAKQLSALKAQVKKKNCSVYGLRWNVNAGGGKTEKSILIFNTKTGELIKARSIPKGGKRTLQAESWTRVTKASLERDRPSDGISQRHHMKLDSGASMVLSGSTAQFMKQSRLSGFLTGDYLTAGISSDPDIEVEVVEPGNSGAVAAVAPADAQPAPASVNAAPAPAAHDSVAAAPDAAHGACLKSVAAAGEQPSPEAKASSAACDEELQIIEGRQALLSAKQSRFIDLQDAHVTGRLSDCLAKVAKLGGKVSDAVKASGEACQAELKRQLAKASEQQVHAMLEAERYHDRRMELIWLIDNKSVRDTQLEREERRHQRDLGYLENCVKEIIDLGGKPSEKAIGAWNTCQREKYAARTQARTRTNELEKRIVSTSDINARRRLAQQIPLPEMKKYWLSEIEREQRQASKR
jgi:hypothetical protein